jgi:hypothetical protein
MKPPDHLTALRNAHAAAEKRIAELREKLVQGAQARNLSREGAKVAAAMFDTMASPVKVEIHSEYDNAGRARGHGKLISSEAVEYETGEPLAAPDESIVEHLLNAAEKMYGKAPLPQAPPSKEALRKRKARAEGRITPRPKRATRTLADEVQSRRKAVETRKKTLAEAEATHAKAEAGDWTAIPQTGAAVARARISLGRAEKTLQTFHTRLKATK